MVRAFWKVCLERITEIRRTFHRRYIECDTPYTAVAPYIYLLFYRLTRKSFLIDNKRVVNNFICSDIGLRQHVAVTVVSKAYANT